MGWDFVSTWPAWATLGLVIYWVVIVIAVINDSRDPTKTLAWLFLLTILPFFGLLFYFFFGRNWKKKVAKSRWVREIRSIADPVMAKIYESEADAHAQAREYTRSHGFDDIVDFIASADGAHAMSAYGVEILVDGENKFRRLKQELAQAKDTINIQYFIWEHDQLTAELTAILLERLKAGVEVRMLNDFVGNIQYKKDELKALAAAGARIDYDVKGIGALNYRNHRKIVVIDGVLGFTGGINVGQEYIDGQPRYPSWRDTHVCFYGPAVTELQKLFAERWHETTGESLFHGRFFPTEFPTPGRRVLAQTVATGVEDPWESARRAHVVAMADARERIWIQSPYFVPTTDIYEGMINASLSGIDVRFMMTGWPDKKIAWYAAETYLLPLIQAGAKVYHYNAGFFHAKTMTLDGKILSIGTMNMDIRSLELHKELMTWFYDEELALEHEAIFTADIERCDLITEELLGSRTGLERFRNSAARIASNLL